MRAFGSVMVVYSSIGKGKFECGGGGESKNLSCRFSILFAMFLLSE
jgi:hypothetical protein